MRCYCCNAALNDVEATRKFRDSGEYAEMCNECVRSIAGEGIEFITRTDLTNEVNEDYDRFDEYREL
jgi:hypothetical protein